MSIIANPPSGSVDAPARRKRAKKIRRELGPFETACSTFERGDHRIIEISRITPDASYYPARGIKGELSLPHGVAYTEAVGLGAQVDTSPRVGAIRRG